VWVGLNFSTSTRFPQLSQRSSCILSCLTGPRRRAGPRWNRKRWTARWWRMR